jgi:DNA-binding XRE family transcriptional regulator
MKQSEHQRITMSELPPDRQGAIRAKLIGAYTDIDSMTAEELLADVGVKKPMPFFFELRAFVNDLRRARESLGLTHQQLAEKSGLSRETVCRLESGDLRNPTWKTLGLYASAVGLHMQLSTNPA